MVFTSPATDQTPILLSFPGRRVPTLLRSWRQVFLYFDHFSHLVWLPGHLWKLWQPPGFLWSDASALTHPLFLSDARSRPNFVILIFILGQHLLEHEFHCKFVGHIDNPQADAEIPEEQKVDNFTFNKKPTMLKKPTMPMDAVMHVETSAKTSAKSVLIAFQVNNSDRTPFFCKPLHLSPQTVRSDICMHWWCFLSEYLHFAPISSQATRLLPLPVSPTPQTLKLVWTHHFFPLQSFSPALLLGTHLLSNIRNWVYNHFSNQRIFNIIKTLFKRNIARIANAVQVTHWL